MKNIISAIIIGVSAGILFWYLIQNISPWDQAVVREYIEKFSIGSGEEFAQFIDDSIKAGVIIDYLDLKNVGIIVLIGSITISSFVTAVHLSIDKLFFKKFYEEPDLILAVRRSIWFPVIICLIIAVKLVGSLNIFYFIILASVIFLITLVEISFSGTKKSGSESSKEDAIINQELIS